VAAPGSAQVSESPFAQGVRRLRRSLTAVGGLALVAALVVGAPFADALGPHRPTANHPHHKVARASWDHPLATHQLGLARVSRLIHGTRISLIVGVSSVLLALFIGVPFGMVAGFYGGRVDSVVMRVMDLILAFPIYLLAIILMVIFTPTAGLIGVVKVTGAIA